MVIGELGKPHGYLGRCKSRRRRRAMLRTVSGLTCLLCNKGSLAIVATGYSFSTHTSVRLSRLYSPLPPITPTSTTVGVC